MTFDEIVQVLGDGDDTSLRSWPFVGPNLNTFISDQPSQETRVEHIEAWPPEAENEYGSTLRQREA
jgi:hypothetical protein